ncbi:malto-oligosyltrehalose synthase [Devosia beringensis]|uniref:malto-oligosyltrehalose synthase n=1 Tax=Devosia beringensis TaxID=2657486 RepID=UPI00186BA36B|nr:malto-oligosyltrehalose synthase [Devosia beringensis]
MIDPIPTATYRIQLREGVGFAEVAAQLDYFAALGISHLYLSPIFAAAAGSTHGYDVIDPTAIEPSLGGRAGFEALAAAAHEKGLGVILDIVPNHTAFTLDNPWLADVLAHGEESRYGRHFDIDWAAGLLALPFLPEPFAAMLAAGAFSASDGFWRVGEMEIPLAADGRQGASTVDDLQALHKRQHWRLRHWETERDSITHRRFFNVTGLIGMRVEDEAVFADTHSLILELVRAGHVDGLRVDHIDGLADPRTYLERLAAALPGTPVWVEKILVGRETLPSGWQTAGTTGYEAGRLLARVLTDKDGRARLEQSWRAYTGQAGDFADVLTQAKLDILHNELAAELHQLVRLGAAALADDGTVEPGPESLRDAVTALLTGMTRYRTYVDGDGADAQDRALIDDIVEAARPGLRSARVLEHLAARLVTPASAAALAFAVRFQQVSGALLAKAQEDTAGFRWTAYLAGNDVGAEPAEATIEADEVNAFLAQRRPSDMTLSTSHDTKRSEDARMRLAAISHLPDEFAGLVEAAGMLPEAADVSPRWRWYIAQSALAIWGAEPEALQERLAAHIVKAMREAKEVTYWTRPVAAIEDPAIAFAAALSAQWIETRPAALARLLETGDALSLTQLTLKCLMPGFPDIYRGCEAPYYTLTDPDSRLPVDWDGLHGAAEAEGFVGDKARLTQTLLGLRAEERAFFDTADARMTLEDDGLSLVRTMGSRTLICTQSAGPHAPLSQTVWQSQYGGRRLTIGWQNG